jgi:hypothetical protein
MNGEKETRTLSVNCGFACLLSDRQGVLDAYDQVAINCGSAVVSAEMNAKLLAKGGNLNSGNIMVREIRGEIIQLDPGTVIDGGASLKDLFVIAKGDLLVRTGGLKALGEAEGVIVTGTLFYPAGEDAAALLRVSGEKQAYPPAAQVVLGDQTLESLIAGSIGPGELPLHGPRIYVDGNFSMEEKDREALGNLESIIVKGRAELPASAVKIFGEKGRAGSYFIFEGRFQEINGFEQFSHNQLAAAAAKGEKITLTVNGCVLFDEDVTAEDLDCIAALCYNGTVLVPGPVKSVLALKVKSGNGFMGDPAKLEELTGRSLKEFASRSLGGQGSSAFNAATYILI